MLLLHYEATKWWPARVTLPIQRIKSPLHHFNACRPKWCSRQDSHLHWRRSRRRVSSVGLRELLAQAHPDGASRRSCPGTTFLQGKSVTLLQGGGKRLANRSLKCEDAPVSRS